MNPRNLRPARAFAAALAVAAMLATTAPGGAIASAATAVHVVLNPSLPVHPYLQYGAQVQPDRIVRAIVRLKPGYMSNSLTRSGVNSKRDLKLINSAVIEIPQRVAPLIGRLPFVQYVSYDGPVIRHSVDATNLKTAYEQTIGTPTVWNSPTVSATGAGITAAVLDTGVNAAQPDLAGPNLICMYSSSFTDCGDGNGHGTHVIGIIKGRDLQGRYVGVAPDSRVISIRIGDANGMGTQSDMVAALQWVYDNHVAYNIKVVNISYAAGTPESYTTSPVDAAVEQLWLNGVTVVAAAGNTGSAIDSTWYAPGNDPFAISVGALDDNGTPSPFDDSLATFSARGTTQDGFRKPEILAPGRKIVSTLAGPAATLAVQRPDSVVDGNYLRLSGTSMAAPVVTGVVGLLLQRNPSLTPNQIKWLLTNTASTYPGETDGAGVVNTPAAFQGAVGGLLGLANQLLVPSASINASTGTVSASASSQSYWNESFWNESYWNESFAAPDQTYWE